MLASIRVVGSNGQDLKRPPHNCMKMIRVIAGLLVCTLTLSSPLVAQNQNPNTTVPEKKVTPAKKPVPGPFHGKLAAVDKTAKTITVGKRTFQITAETKINKAGQPATLNDGVVGEVASGYVKPTEDGKWLATTINFGPKPADKAKKN